MAEGDDQLRRLGVAALGELTGDLLPFWHRLADRAHGGHLASVTNDGVVDPTGPKSTVFVARILWTMSEAWRVFRSDTSLAQAEHAKRFLLDRLRDHGEGGFFWSVRHDGTPLDTGKHVYAHAFAIYGLTAFAVATGDGEARAEALQTFATLETRARRDRGYAEAFDRAWRPIDNQRLQSGGVVGARTMNTHIHLVEALTPLLAIAEDGRPRAALEALHRLILDRFLENEHRFAHSVLDERLEPLGGPISMGHDIETAWLLDASADALGDAALSTETRVAARRLAQSAAAFGYCGERGFLTERSQSGLVDPWRVWWTQAEAVVGLVNEYQRAGDRQALDRAATIWGYIERAILDRAGGEWFWRVDAEGRPDLTRRKVEPWKEPYHQARACFELIRRSGVEPGLAL